MKIRKLTWSFEAEMKFLDLNLEIILNTWRNGFDIWLQIFYCKITKRYCVLEMY